MSCSITVGFSCFTLEGRSLRLSVWLKRFRFITQTPASGCGWLNAALLPIREWVSIFFEPHPHLPPPPLADSQGICKDSLLFLISWTKFRCVKSCFHFLALGKNDHMCQQSTLKSWSHSEGRICCSSGRIAAGQGPRRRLAWKCCAYPVIKRGLLITQQVWKEPR